MSARSRCERWLSRRSLDPRSAAALGACAIGATVMSPVTLGAAGHWLLAGVGVFALFGSLTFLAVWLGPRKGFP